MYLLLCIQLIVRIRVQRPIVPFTPSPLRRLGGSSAVAAGILASRIFGLLRESAIGHFFGVHTAAADAFRGAIRIPNLLQNLFGEGVLSASFISVYAKLRGQGDDDEAGILAETVFSLLALVSAATVLLGILLTPLLTTAIVPGFTGERLRLTRQIVPILFPGTGLLVMSAWCLGILNSHRKFLLSYTAPVAMNMAMIITLVALGPGTAQNRLIVYLSWGYLLGTALMFLVQLPVVLQLLPAFRPALQVQGKSVRLVIDNFGPAFLGRGAVQISSYVDQMIASWLPAGSVAALGYAQVIALLPVSLFGMSISAAELPLLSSATGTPEQVAELLRTRISSGLRRIAVLVIPSSLAFLLLGDILAGALYQTGRFTRSDAVDVWVVLAGSSVGLLASASGRLYSSGFFALLDTRTPLRYGLVRIVFTTVLGLFCALLLPKLLGVDLKWGTFGLTGSAGVAGWIEFSLLRRGLSRRIGYTGVPAGITARLWISAIAAALCAFFLKLVALQGGGMLAQPIILAVLTLPIYGALYFGIAAALRVDEATIVLTGVRRRVGL